MTNLKHYLFCNGINELKYLMSALKDIWLLLSDLIHIWRVIFLKFPCLNISTDGPQKLSNSRMY